MTTITTRGTGYSPGAPTESMLWVRPRRGKQDGSLPGILCFHGHGGDCGTWHPRGDGFSPGNHIKALAEAGFIVCGIDDAGGFTWGNQASVNSGLDGYNWLLGAGGAKGPKIGVTSASMGGLTALNFIKQHPTLVAAAWLWNPPTDLDWLHSTVGYTPAWGAGLANNATWTTEINTAFGTYAGSAGYRVRDEYASWRGLGIPIRVAHADDDTTIPVAMNKVGFVPGVNDPLVTFRQTDVGGHTALFGVVPERESVDFFLKAF